MTRPLGDVRVVELGGIGPAPHAGMLMADLGADVIRVDRVTLASGGRGDRTRHDLLHRGKRSLAIDLKSARGVEAILRLVAGCDVLIEGFRPGVAEGLGIGPEDCLARNPKLVFGRVTGWGQEGPLSHTAGHDIDYLAASGVLGAIGTEDEPIPPLNLVADFGGGSLYLVAGVLAGLVSARATGEGTVVDAAMVDGVAHLATMAHAAIAEGWWGPRRRSNLLDGGAPFYTTYRTADNAHVAVGALEPQFYAELVEGLGLDASELPSQMDRERWDDMRTVFAARFAARTAAEWESVFSGSDACVTVVVGLADAPGQPHMAARETFVAVEGVTQPRPAPRFDGRRALPGAPPHIGQHTDEILAEAGYAAAEIGVLRSQSIIG
jgi:alpha-methylacyl-CoA racemase